MQAPQTERRRIPRGPDLPARLSTGWVRWVYLYAAAFALAVLIAPAASWYLAESGSPERAEAALRFRTLAGGIAIPLALLAVAAAAHGGAMSRRVADYVASFKGPLECLRSDLARHQRRSRDVVEVSRRMTAAAEDPEVSPGELAALANSVQDTAEKLVSRPGASVSAPAGGERALQPENAVAAALS